jgi:Galactose oxidase, central domain
MKTFQRSIFSVALGLAGLVLNLSVPRQVLADYFTNTSSLNISRESHTATLLTNGMVLVASGYSSGLTGLASTELYNPVSGIWTVTNAMTTGRSGAKATLLLDGEVLVEGGISVYGAHDRCNSSAETYNPATGTWSAAGSMSSPRIGHTATLLLNGNILVVGGEDTTNWYSSADLFNPTSRTWTPTASLAIPCEEHTATLLPNGSVLVVGGWNDSSSFTVLSSSALYNPTNGTWTPTTPLATAREGHTATLLSNGQVLIAGGDGNSSVLSSAVLYNPTNGTWTATGSLNTARYNHTATLLQSGKVLVAGGLDIVGGTLSSAELYDPATGLWTMTAPLNNARWEFTATLLTNGQVLAAAGQGNNGVPNNSAELYVLKSLPVTTIFLTNPTKLPDGTFQFSFTNTPSTSFTALASTNLALSLSNWKVLGTVTEISSGLFQFSDYQATNNTQQFYRICSP